MASDPPTHHGGHDLFLAAPCPPGGPGPSHWFLGAGGWVGESPGFLRWPLVGGWVGIGGFLSFLRCGLAKKPNPGASNAERWRSNGPGSCGIYRCRCRNEQHRRAVRNRRGTGMDRSSGPGPINPNCCSLRLRVCGKRDAGQMVC